MNEQAVLFGCQGETLVGILSLPAVPASTGVVVVVGGPQYRAGSHRQFVVLARSLAAAGIAVLRFDYRGMGDSSGSMGDFLHASADIGAALDTLQQHAPQVQRMALWGLCDAASAALLYLHDTRDPRVAGLCLLNPWVRSAASLARTQVKHYYVQRLMQPSFWRKLVGGGVAMAALKGLAHNIRLSTTSSQLSSSQIPFQHRMATAWMGYKGRILLLLSGDDYTAKEFLEYAGTDAAWSHAFQHPRLDRHDLAGADHTFSKRADQTQAEKLTLQWVQHLD